MSDSANAVTQVENLNALEQAEWDSAREAFTRIRAAYVRLVELRTERRQFAQAMRAASVIALEDAQEWSRALDGGIAPNNWTTEGASALSEFRGAVNRLIGEYADAYPDTKEATWL